MKGNSSLDTQIPWCRKPLIVRLALSGLSAATLVLLVGCATHAPVAVTGDELQPLAGPLRVHLGTLAVVPASQPATVGFQRPEGRTKTFGDGASVTAAKMLDPSTVSPDPGVCAVVGVAGAIVAPVAAVVAGNSAARARLAPDQLSGCESNLLYEMRTMAAQERFRDTLVKVAHEKTGRQLLPLGPTQTPALDCPSAETVLETQVQELRLERTGKGDTSYALRIQAQVRVVRAADGTVLYEHPVEYRTGTCLFLDWTLANSFQQVADYAYHEMAAHVVDAVLVATPEGPLVAGAGYKKSPARPQTNALELARRNSSRELTLQPVSYPVSDPAPNPGTIHVYPQPPVAPVGVPAPLSRAQAEEEALRSLEWTFDGLYNHPNPVVYAPAIAAAIPVSFWNRVVADVHGLSERHAYEAAAQLRRAAFEARPNEQLAGQVAQQLAPQTSQLVLLEQKPFRFGEPGMYAEIAGGGGTTPSALRTALTPVGFSAGSDADSALEIIVHDVRLAGTDGVNPPLALCLEAEARLRRARDGELIYSCPISYRGVARSATKWAAHDAQLFRQELRNSYREVSATLVDQLIARGLVAPGGPTPATLASQ